MLLLFLLASQIDLNQAPLEEIYKLPVDSTIARRIYQYRQLYGAFLSVYELRRVDGIDGILFEEIKPHVKIIVPVEDRAGWSSILYEQRKLASEEPPTKAAIDEWEDLIRAPMNVNTATFDELLSIDRMTPIDAAAIMRHRQYRPIRSTRDLRRVRELTHYAYTSLRKYVQFEDDPLITKPYGSVRLRLYNLNRIDIDEEENLATRISYLESAVNGLDTTAANLIDVYGWEGSHVAQLRTNLDQELDTLYNRHARPYLYARLRANYQQKMRVGMAYDEFFKDLKGYVSLSHLGPVARFYLGHYRVAWGEGLMIDNSGEYRARIFDRTEGIFGDLTDNYGYNLFGAAGVFRFPWNYLVVKPSLCYSNISRDAMVNPDGSIWSIFPNPFHLAIYEDNVDEQVYAANLAVASIERINPGTQFALQAMRISYDKRFDRDPKWVDIPLDTYDPTFYPEITTLSNDSVRQFLGASFILPLLNAFLSGEIVRQHDEDNVAYAYLLKGRIQYDWLYLNVLYRDYDPAYDNPFHRGFSEYRRYEDTPFERPYALVDPEYASLYDDPMPKAEQGIFLETRYQLTRNIILTRAYLDIYKNVSHNLLNQRGYVEFEFQPIWPVRIRYSQKLIRKHLPRPILATLSATHESALRVFFYLPNFDALRFEARLGHVDLTAVEGENKNLDGGFLSFSFTHNFSTAFSLDGGIALWITDGMSQWIFEDVGIDFLYGNGVKYYFVASQKIGSLLLKLKFRQKFTKIPHNALYNNPDVYYPDLPGYPVYDYTDNENSTGIHLQLDYLF